MKVKNLLCVLLLFFAGIQIVFSLSPSPLSDDLTHYEDVLSLNQGHISWKEVYIKLFNDPTRHTRPISPIILGSFIVLSKFSKYLFFLWGLSLTIWSINLLYKVIDNYFKNEWFALLVCFLALLFPLSSANLFSPVMQTIQLVVITFLYSLLLSKRNELKYYFIIGFLSTISVLFYELNILLFPILAIAIWYNNQEKKWLKITLSTIFPTLIGFLYKTTLVRYLYADYSNYASAKLSLNLDKITGTFIALIKLFTTDYVYIILNSLKYIDTYSVFDIILMIVGVALSIYIAVFYKPIIKINRRLMLLSFLFFFLTILVFFISIYPPIAFGFENRILLWVRFSSMLLLSIFINNLLFKIKKSKYQNLLLRFGLFIILSINAIAIISEKNSWIKASDYNEKVIRKIVNKFSDSNSTTEILVFHEKEIGKKFITDESILDADYEIVSALNIYEPSSKLNGKKIIYINPSYYSLYTIFGRDLNKRPKSNCIITDRFIKVGKRTLHFPFYIYNLEDDTKQLITNKKELELR